MTVPACPVEVLPAAALRDGLLRPGQEPRTIAAVQVFHCLSLTFPWPFTAFPWPFTAFP